MARRHQARSYQATEPRGYRDWLRRKTRQGISDDLLNSSHIARRQLLSDLANSQDAKGVKWFWRIWSQKLWPEEFPDLIQIGNELREIWRMDNAPYASGPTFVLGGMEIPLNPEFAVQEMLDKWLSWRPSPEQERVYRSIELAKRKSEVAPLLERSDAESIDRFLDEIDSGQRAKPGFWMLPVNYSPIRCWLPTHSFVPDPRALRPMLVQGVLEHWGYLRYCANTNCSCPYFIGKRRDQMVCDAEICKAEKQREHALKWWRENRAKENQRPHKTNSKNAKKENKRNVSR